MTPAALAARLAVAALLATTFACGGAVQRAERHLEAGRYDRASELAARAVDEAPSARAWAVGGEAAFALDDLETAWAARADARALDPGHPATLALGGRLAVATDDERLLTEVWVDAWDAERGDVVLDAIAEGGLVTAARALATMWRETPGAADALLEGLSTLSIEVTDRESMTSALADAADLQLYRLLANRDLDEAEALIAALEPLLGDTFVIRKHRTLVDAERTLHPSRGPLLALVGDDLDLLSALAFELRARGVHRTAALAWRIVAGHSSGDAAAEAWRQAGESEYRIGLEARAREAHEEAFDASGRTAAMALDLYRAAASRGDLEAFDRFVDRVDGVGCAESGADAFAEVFDALVEAWSQARRPAADLVARLDARAPDPACGGDHLLLVAGMRMAAERYEPLVAITILERAVLDRPNGGATRAIVELSEARADPLGAAESLQRYIDRTTIGGWPDDDDDARALLGVLTAGRSDAVRGVRVDALRSWHAAVPGDRDVTRMLATDVLDAGGQTLPVWDAHADASDDPLAARLFAAAWMTARGVDPTTRIDLLERIVTDPASRRLPLTPTTDDADTVYESALLLLVEAFLETDQDARVVETLEAWIASRGDDDPATWDHIWSRRALLATLGADERARLARRAVAAGYATPDIWHELAIAESGAGRDDAAREAIEAALEVAPERTGELVDRLVDRGRVELALSTLDAYIRLRGDDAFALRRTLELHVDELLRARGSSDADRLRLHRNGVAQAVTRVLDRSQDLHIIDLEQLRIAGLHELAWRVGARRVTDPTADRYASIEVVRDGLSASLPMAMVEPWLAPWIDRLDAGDRDDIAGLALVAGHASLALDLRLAAFYDTRRPAERVEMLPDVMYPASIALSLDAYRSLVDELVEAPAHSILDPAVTPIPPFEAWSDDEDRGAELLATAAALYEMRGLDVDTARAGLRALELGLDVSAPTLERTVEALTRIQPDDALRAAVSAAVGSASLGAEGWSRTARVWIDNERWDDAAWALERADRLVASDDVSILSWSGVVAAHRGDDDGVRAAVAGLTRWGRGADAELSAGLLRTHVAPALIETGRHDLLDAVTEAAARLQPGDDAIQLELASRLVARGDLDTARRRVADIVGRTRVVRRQIEALATAGFVVDAARLIERADSSDPWDVLPDGFDDPGGLPAVFARLRGTDTWFALFANVEPTSIDEMIIRLHDQLGALCFDALSPCGVGTIRPATLVTDERLVRDDVIDLAAVSTAGGDASTHRRAWDRAVGQAFGFASFDAQVPPAVVLADHAEAGRLDLLPAWLDGLGASVDGATEARRWLALLQHDPLTALADPDVDAATLGRAVAAGWWFEVGDVARAISADSPGDPRVLPGIVALGRAGAHDDARALAAGWLAATGGLSHPRADVAEALVAGGLVDDGMAHLLTLIDTAPDTVAERAAVAGLATAMLEDDDALAERIATRWLDRASSSRSHRQRVASVLMDGNRPGLAARIYTDLALDLPADAATREALITALATAGDDDGAIEALQAMHADGLVTSWAVQRLSRVTDADAAPRLAAALADWTATRDDATLDAVAARLVAVHADGPESEPDSGWIDAAGQHPAATGALIDHVARLDVDVAAALARAALAGEVRSGVSCDAAIRALAAAGAAVDRPDDVLAHVEACRPLAADPNGWQTAIASVMASHGAWPVAEALATGVLLAEPDNGTARAVRAASRAELGRIDDAIADLEASHGLDAGWRDALVQATRALVRAGAHDAAMRHADRLATRVSFRGVVLPGTPRTNRDGLFDAFAALSPSPELTLRWLESRFPDLVEHPELTASTGAITVALADAGRIDEALDAWHRAAVSRPDSGMIHNNMAWVLAERGLDLERAEALARRALSLDREPSANTLDTLGWVLHLQGRHTEARAIMVQALMNLHGMAPSSRAAARPVLVEHLAAIDAAIAAATETDSASASPSSERRRDRRRDRRRR